VIQLDRVVVKILQRFFGFGRASLSLIGERKGAKAVGRRDGVREVALLGDREEVIARFVQSVALVRHPSKEIVCPVNIEQQMMALRVGEEPFRCGLAPVQASGLTRIDAQTEQGARGHSGRLVCVNYPLNHPLAGPVLASLLVEHARIQYAAAASECRGRRQRRDGARDVSAASRYLDQ